MLNHGSIIDGVRLSRADRAVYKHTDPQDLSRVLDEAEKHSPELPQNSRNHRRSIFDGWRHRPTGSDTLLFAQITVPWCTWTTLMVKEFWEKEGEGSVSHFGLSREKVQVEMGTFSKAFGVVGGHISGSKDLIDFAYNKSRTWLLSGSAPPAVVAACTAAVDVLESERNMSRRCGRILATSRRL